LCSNRLPASLCAAPCRSAECRSERAGSGSPARRRASSRGAPSPSNPGLLSECTRTWRRSTRVPRDTNRHDGHCAVPRDVQLRQWPGKIWPTVGDRGGAGVVRSGVVHHDASDVLEVAVAAAAPAGILDEVDTFGLKDVGKPDRISGPRSCLRHFRSKLSGCERHCNGTRVPKSNPTAHRILRWCSDGKLQRDIGNEIGLRPTVLQGDQRVTRR
jgi:hypothetical protein